MTKKALTIFILFAVILTVFSLTIIRKTNKSYIQNELSIGSLIFPNFNIDKISLIKIIKPDNTTILLDKQNNNWTVKSLYGYPADTEKLSSLLNETANLKIIQNIRIIPNAYKELNLTLPDTQKDSGATEIQFQSNKNNVLYSLLVGKKRVEQDLSNRTEFAVGRYIKTPAESNIYLTDELLDSINLSAEDWLYDHTLSITDIKSIELSKGSKIEWFLSRSKHDEDLQLKGAPKYTDINNEKIKSIEASLNNLKFSSVTKKDTPVSKTGLDNPICLTIETFNSIKYELKIGKISDKSRYIEFKINTPSSDILSEKQKTLKKLFQNWIYLVDSNRIDPLLSSKKSLMTPQKQKKVPLNTYSQPIS